MSSTPVSPDQDAVKVTISVLAKGLVETHRHIVHDRKILRQNHEMDFNLRRGLSLLSAICLKSGYSIDIGCQPNAFTVLAGRPVGEWGPKPFATCEDKNLVLVDAGCGVPTQECRDVAASEGEAAEDIFHDRLRSASQRLGARQSGGAYTKVREFVVRNPCLPTAKLNEFVQDFPEMASDIMSFYRPLPHSAPHGRHLNLCAGCGAPLFPSHDSSSYPSGRCAIRECRMARPSPSLKCPPIQVDVPDAWRLADNAVLAYWVGPGLPEIELFDSIKSRGDVVLYPFSDAADIGIGKTAVGIDIKSYSSATRLGLHFASKCEGLRMFDRRIVAVPDAWLRQDRDYLHTLKSVAGTRFALEFKTISATKREFSV